MVTASNEDNAGVRIPPPLLFVLPLALGLLLHRLVPLVRLPPDTAAWLARTGAVLSVLALVLMFWALFTFKRARTAVVPIHPASTLVAHGPFRFTRNPMYLGLTLLYLGVSIWAGAAWPLLMLPLILVVLRTQVINREESYLARRFGDAYRAYQRRVRRWL